MSIPHVVVLHILEKNCTVDQLGKLISILEQDYNFEQLGSSFESPVDGNQHRGSSLIMRKPFSGETTQGIFEALSSQLDGIDTGTEVSFECQLTVAGPNVVSDIIVIE